MAEPVVSIVIPTRNRLRFLQEAVESVRRQTYPNWELCICDDASRGNIRTGSDHRIHYVRSGERLGISPHTITTHIKNLYRKLQVRCAAGAVMREEYGEDGARVWL